jgi:hypothetical protein
MSEFPALICVVVPCPLGSIYQIHPDENNDKMIIRAN